MNTPPQPTTQSPAFRLLVFGALLAAATVFILALHHPQHAELATIKETTDGWWMHQPQPTSAPTPRAAPTVQPRPVLMVQQPPRITPQPTPKPPSAAWLRYQRAIEVGMGSDSSSARELPQLIRPIGQPLPTPTPNIFALGAYPQP